MRVYFEYYYGIQSSLIIKHSIFANSEDNANSIYNIVNIEKRGGVDVLK